MRRHLTGASAAGVAALLLITACGPDSVGPADDPPQITISGVQDGGQYSGSVTITIAVDRGSWEATLNGAPFASGQTVAIPGQYSLDVTARSGVMTASMRLTFVIAAAPGGTLIIRVLDLGPNEAGGGGDAILVSDSSAAGLVHALIDAGPAGADGIDAGYVARQLAALRIDSLAFLLLTHAHGDHYLGMPAVVSASRIGNFFYNGQIRNLASYSNLVTQAQAKASTTLAPTDTVPFTFGRSSVQSRFTIIPPLRTYLNNPNASSDQLNEGSLGAALRRGSFTMFFTGDGEVEANVRWRTLFAPYTRQLRVLKVGHHGANNAIFDNGFSGTSAWLQHTAPALSIISSNGITHPRINALSRLLQQSNHRTYCTSVHGQIEIRVFSDGAHVVNVQRNAASDCVPGSTATT